MRSTPRQVEIDRRRMLELHLAARGIDDPGVLAAMVAVPREEFVPEGLLDRAYADRPLPVGHGQTISQPYTVAVMAQAASLTGGERVLEIGTGTGYGAAVLARLAREVISIERIEMLARSAALRLARLGIENVEVRVGDGSVGLIERAPYDAIVVTAGAPRFPMALAEQLADGGRCVIPIGGKDGQRLLRVTRRGDAIREDDLGPFTFVPLIGADAWDAA